MYVIGKTGTGKSTMLERLILSDIKAGEGLALVDPHGDLAERIAAQIPVTARTTSSTSTSPTSHSPSATTR
jgi:ABC-type ATPase involved in cell division